MGKTNSIILKVLMIIWALLVIPDYFFNHSYYGNVASNFAYAEYLIFTIIAFGGFLFWRMGKNGDIMKSFSISIAGWHVYLGTMVSALVLYFLFHNKLEMEGSAFTAGLRAIGTGTLYSLAFFWIILSSFATGQFVMKRIASHYHPVSFKILSIALGLSGIGTIATLLGLFHFMNIYALWIITILPVAIFHKEVLDFLQSVFIRPVTYKSLNIWKVLPLMVLSIFLASGFLSALKTFPIGFDGAGTYMNITSLISDYNGLPEGGQAFSWSVIMALGEVMFQQTPISILISHFTIFLALIVMYRLARLAMTPSRSWIPVTIFYALPVIVFQTVREEKTDFGLLFIILAAFLLVLEPRFSKQKSDVPIQPIWIWGIAGWLMGFAFGIKLLALYGIIGLVVLWAYRGWGKLGAFGSLALATAALFIGGLNRFAYMDLGKKEVLTAIAILSITGFISIAYAWVSQGKVISKTQISKLAAFFLFMIIPFLPWSIKHIQENGKLSVSHILSGKSPNPTIKASLKLYADEADLNPLQDKRDNIIRMEMDSLPSREFQNAPARKKKKKQTKLSTSEREEIKRYMGYEIGYPLYHTVPYDATMGNNIPDRSYIDISFLFLLIIPFLLFRLDKKGKIANPIYFLVIVTSFLGLGWISHYIPDADYSKLPEALQASVQKWGALNYSSFPELWSSVISSFMTIFKPIDQPLYQALGSFGFSSVLIAIILFTAAAWWMMQDKFKALEPAMQEITVLLYSTFLLWLISSNNIPWYGFSSFALASIFIGYLLQKPEWLAGDENKKFTTYFLGIILGIFFLSAIMSRLSNPEINGEDSKSFIDRVFIQQASLGKTNEEVMDGLSPVYNNAFDYLNQNMDDKIYRVGTQLNYHIQQNDRRVYEDNQLYLFGFYNRRLPDTYRFIPLLKENGYKYLIYDFGTPMLDRTPEQSLMKRSDVFLSLLFNSPDLQIVVTDRIIQTGNPNDFVIENGRRVNGVKYGVGQLTQEFVQKYVKKNGTFMIFEIK